MRFRFRLIGAALFSLTTLSCGGDDAGLSPGDDGTGEDPSSAETQTHDASIKRDAGSHTSPRDASTPVQRADAGDSTDPGTEDPPSDPAFDAGKGPSVHDAGLPSKSDAGKPVVSGKPDAGSTGGTCDTLTYASFGQAFLSSYCVSCHAGFLAQKGVKLDSLSGLQSSKSKVKSEVSTGSMPPLGSKAPSSSERMQFGQWIDCGAK